MKLVVKNVNNNIQFISMLKDSYDGLVIVMTEKNGQCPPSQIKNSQYFRGLICLHHEVEWGKRGTYSGRPIKES